MIVINVETLIAFAIFGIATLILIIEILIEYMFKRKEREGMHVNRFKEMREELFEIQVEYEMNEKWNEQSIRVGQRVRALLNIYEQIIIDDRVFEEEYLREYLGK